MKALPIVEVFSSIQGEGPYVGVRQLFIRVPLCNLKCPYCDTIIKSPNEARIEKVPGSQKFEFVNNPIDLDSILEIIESFDLSIHHSVSITGGEPLLWSRELSYLLPKIKEKGLRIYLETNGTLPENLEEIIQYVDIISMDFKLPYDSKNHWLIHQKFLQKSLIKEVFVKLVIDEAVSFSNLETARNLIADINKDVLLILQPVTPFGGLKAPRAIQMLELQQYFLGKLKNVRVIPQTHVFMGQL